MGYGFIFLDGYQWDIATFRGQSWYSSQTIRWSNDCANVIETDEMCRDTVQSRDRYKSGSFTQPFKHTKVMGCRNKFGRCTWVERVLFLNILIVRQRCMSSRNFKDLRNEMGDDRLNPTRRIRDLTTEVLCEHLFGNTVNDRNTTHSLSTMRDQALNSL